MTIMARLLNDEFISTQSATDPRTQTSAIDAQQMETDHRIANSIQFAAAMLRHESRQITTVKAARLAMTNAAGRLNAVAQMHRQLARSLPDQDVDLAQFLEPFCEDISQSIGVVLNIESEEVTLRADVATQLCIILNELAMNAVKHGDHRGQPVTLTLKAVRRGDSWLRITLHDNGTGLPEDFCLHGATGLGMTIVTSTVKKLGGSIRILADSGDGAGFEIDLPLEPSEYRVATARKSS